MHTCSLSFMLLSTVAAVRSCMALMLVPVAGAAAAAPAPAASAIGASRRLGLTLAAAATVVREYVAMATAACSGNASGCDSAKRSALSGPAALEVGCRVCMASLRARCTWLLSQRIARSFA